MGRWLLTGGVGPTEAITLDGKTSRGIHGDAAPGVHLVAAFTHHSGAAPGHVPSPGKGQELAAVKTQMDDVDLAGRTVTVAALLTQRDLCPRIVAGGD